ncbi:MAG: ArsR family transcriptional regulator [bacterium]|nr:ArsR family transcriptional regulator [bacterium]
MEYQVTADNLDFFQTLASKTRLKIIEIVRDEEKNIKDLAEIIGVSSTIIARHINQLEKADIIQTVNVSGKRGLQKICRLKSKKITLDFDLDSEDKNSLRKFSIPVGNYKNYDVNPTCGLASAKALIGLHDDPRYFSHPDHYLASIIWYTDGWVDYVIPSYMLDYKPITSIEVSLELCSEYPFFRDNYKSDIFFIMNGINIGMWTAPGNYGDRRGKYNPPWWTMGSEYGFKVTIIIDKHGTHINNQQISSINLEDLDIKICKDLLFRISSPADSANPGGVTIFGKGFGDYNQDIEVKIKYE